MKKIAFAHDHLFQIGGAEKVLVALASLDSQAPIFTLINDPKITKKILNQKNIVTSNLQKIPGINKLFKYFLVLMPRVWEKTDLSSYTSNRQSFIDNKFKDTKYLKFLTYSQLIGIKYLHDIEKRIPRKEIESMEKVIKTLLTKMNKDIIMKVCGSYRRGNKDSGDIDILLSHPDILKNNDIKRMNQNILLSLIICLQQIGFLYDHITVDGNTKYMGICKLKRQLPYRRIDIRFISYNAFPSALLYFTGSADLNKKMRLEAIIKGYRLNEYGLYKLDFNKQKNQDVLGEKFETPTEESIFKLLDMDYLIPTERNIK